MNIKVNEFFLDNKDSEFENIESETLENIKKVTL